MSKKVYFLGLILSLLITLPVYSQATAGATCSIKGILVDSVSGQTIPYVTVSLSSVDKPTVYLKRVAAGANGSFEITTNKMDSILLNFESVGMKKLVRNISIKDQDKALNLGKLKMVGADTKLGEVTVLANKPLIKVDLDKISYDTKSDPDSKSTTVLEMLKKVPMVTVDGEDKIQVKGSGNFKIYMNGKPSTMVSSNPSQVLKSIPASSVKNIEVITEPGAKYDAEGVGGIINIVTEKALAGYTGSVRAGIDSRGGYNGGIYFSTKTGKFGVTTNLNYNQSKSPDGTIEFYQEKTKENGGKDLLFQNGSNNSKYNFGYGNVEASYEIDSLNLLSLTVGGHEGGHNSNVLGFSNQVNELNVPQYEYKQLTNNKGNWGGIDLTLDYQKSFKKPDKLFTLSYKLGSTPNNSDNFTKIYDSNTGLFPNSEKKINSDAQGTEHTFQADYTEPFNKIHVLEGGVKYILRLNNSDNTYQQFNGTDWMDIANKNGNDMNHKQHILGAYGSYTLKLKKISFRGGVRLEHTKSIVEFDKEPAKDFDVPFTNLVPSVVVTYQMDQSSNLRLSYNQRLSRPGIWYLNPFIDDSNPQEIRQGNPKLDAEIDNSFSLNYGKFTQKVNLNLGLYTSFTDNSIESVTSLVDKVLHTTYKNIGSSKNYGLSAYFNWTVSQKCRFYFNGNGGYNEMKMNDGSGLENNGWNYGASFGSQLTLPLEIKLGINVGYYSSNISLQGERSDYHYSGFSLGRDFLKKKLNVSVRIQEPFEKNRNWESTMRTPQFYQKSISISPARYMGLSVSYRFGEMKEQVKKAQRSITNDDVKGGGAGQSGGGGQ